MTVTPPRWRHEYASLAWVASDVAAKRHRAYPALIDAGRITAAEASWQLDLADWIAADWNLIAGHQGPEGCRTPARRATLLTAAARCRRRADALAAALTGPARRYADHAGPAAARRDLADDLVSGDTAARLGEWIDALDYAELVETLAWWERQESFPHLQISEARRRAARAAAGQRAAA